MISLDRFSQGLPDIQDMPPLNHCYRCGDEIYDRHYAALGLCEDCDEEYDKELEECNDDQG